MAETPTDDKPAWWVENERLRDDMELAAYEPPRFEDGTYTHEVVDDLEARLDCTIMFRSAVNPEYPEDWEVRVDGRRVTGIGRHRDRNGNTVYECPPEPFERAIERAVDAAGRGTGEDT